MEYAKMSTVRPRPSRLPVLLIGLGVVAGARIEQNDHLTPTGSMYAGNVVRSSREKQEVREAAQEMREMSDQATESRQPRGSATREQVNASLDAVMDRTLYQLRSLVTQAEEKRTQLARIERRLGVPLSRPATD